MKVTVERGDNSEVSLKIVVEGAELVKASDAASKRIAGKINIPGFRKGKAPKKIVERFAGKEAVLNEAFDIVAQKSFADALKEENLEPVTRPEIDIDTLEEGKDVEFTAKFTNRPEITLGEYKGFNIEKKVEEVTDEDVEKQLERIRDNHSQLVDVTGGRSVQQGDFTTLDYEGFVDGEPFAGGSGKDYPLQIGSGSFIPGFEDQLVGANIDEEREVNVTFPEEYHSKELAGKSATFKCVVHSIKEKQLPELDDEFAKKASSFETLAELRDDVRKRLSDTAEQKAEADRAQAAVEKALENTQVEIPEVMVDMRVDTMLQELALRLEQQGMSLEQYLKYSGMDIARIRDEQRETARKNVKVDLMLEEIAKAEDIKVEGADLDREVQQMALTYGATPKQVQKIITEQGRVGDLARNVLHKKAMQLIVTSVTE